MLALSLPPRGWVCHSMCVIFPSPSWMPAAEVGTTSWSHRVSRTWRGFFPIGKFHTFTNVERIVQKSPKSPSSGLSNDQLMANLFQLYLCLHLKQIPDNISWDSFLKKFYWSIVDLQCCVNFYHTAKWFSYTYIFFHILFHYDLSQDIEYSSLCYTVRSCGLSILYIIVCTEIHFQLPLFPKVTNERMRDICNNRTSNHLGGQTPQILQFMIFGHIFSKWRLTPMSELSRLSVYDK